MPKIRNVIHYFLFDYFLIFIHFQVRISANMIGIYSNCRSWNYTAFDWQHWIHDIAHDFCAGYLFCFVVLWVCGLMASCDPCTYTLQWYKIGIVLILQLLIYQRRKPKWYGQSRLVSNYDNKHWNANRAHNVSVLCIYKFNQILERTY